MAHIRKSDCIDRLFTANGRLNAARAGEVAKRWGVLVSLVSMHTALGVLRRRS